MGRGLDGFDPAVLCELRLRRGMTQDELADASGVVQPDICGLERGRHRPSVRTVHALASALGVPPEQLFTTPPANPLVRLRLRGGLTQREAAALADVPVSSYAALERRERNVPVEVVTRLAAGVDRSP